MRFALYVFAWSLDCFIGLSASFLICQSECFDQLIVLHSQLLNENCSADTIEFRFKQRQIANVKKHTFTSL